MRERLERWQLADFDGAIFARAIRNQRARRLFAFVVRDFSTAIDVTDAVRDRLATETRHDATVG